MSHLGEIIIGLFSFITIGYLSILVILYIFQRRLLYLPNKALKETSFYHLPAVETIAITTQDGHPITCWYYPSQTQHIVLYCHGNKGHIGDRSEKLKHFIQQGFGIFAPSYRGYGTSKGFPTENGLYNDIRASIKYLLSQGIASNHIILYGESLGSGIATQMATEYDVKALVLEAPYTSMIHVAKSQYPYIPVHYLLKDRFETESKISKVKAPILIFHGRLDKLIPITHGQKLFSLATSYKKTVFYDDVDHTSYNPELIASALAEFISEQEQSAI